jgi:hypothetical protein
MTAPVQDVPTAPAAPRLYWWKEVLLIAGFYVLYTASRNQFGSARLAPGEQPTEAFDNAVQLIDWEKAIRLFVEPDIQSAFIDFRWFIWFWNVFYGTAHFVVTIGLFLWMFHRARPMFTKWRNCILATTALALIGFSLFPVMPPRLLDSTSRYGGACLQIERDGGTCTEEALAEFEPTYGFVDTLAEVGGLWSFDSGAMTKLSNQYAAMPSLHCAWATWCALVGWRITRRRWARTLLVVYPFLTLFCIIVTANHYWIDGVGGLVTLAAGYFVGSRFDLWNNARLARKAG